MLAHRKNGLFIVELVRKPARTVHGQNVVFIAHSTQVLERASLGGTYKYCTTTGYEPMVRIDVVIKMKAVQMTFADNSYEDEVTNQE